MGHPPARLLLLGSRLFLSRRPLLALRADERQGVFGVKRITANALLRVARVGLERLRRWKFRCLNRAMISPISALMYAGHQVTEVADTTLSVPDSDDLICSKLLTPDDLSI